MSTKTYKADTLQKVLEIIRQELGPDALILSSTRNEFDGKVEVAAMLQQHTETDGFIVSDPHGAILDSHSLIDELFQQDLSRKRRRDQIKTLQNQLHSVMVSLGVNPSTTTDLISQLDSYTASDDQCSNTTCKHIVHITNYSGIVANSETQLEKAVQIQPVSVAIQANLQTFQFYFWFTD